MSKEEHIKYEMLVKNLPDAFAYHKIIKDRKGKAVDYVFLNVNDAFEEMTGLSKDTVIGKKVTVVHPGIEKSSFDWIGTYARVSATGETIRFQQYFDNAGKWYDITAFSDTPGYFAVVFRNITEYKQTEIFLKLNGEVLSILNSSLDFKESMRLILRAIKHDTGCDAVGIRLQTGEDFPFFLQTGFSKDFLMEENSLLERDKDGSICRNPDGTVNLECTCGLVVAGKTEASNPLFTDGGSAWTNNSFPLLEIPESEDPRRKPRNRCIHEGYASVAIIPLRTRTGIVGLLQLNGKAKGIFSLPAIKFLEDIASRIGEALIRKQFEESLSKSEEYLSTVLATLPDIVIRADENGRYLDILTSEETKLPLPKEQILGKTVHEVLPEKEADEIMSAIKAALKEKSLQIAEYKLNLPSGNLNMEARIAPLNDKEVIAHIVDITDRKRVEEQLRYDALHDSLTGLPNRPMIMDRLERAILRRRRKQSDSFIFLFLDLDDFKKVNDAMGHVQGDNMLKEVAGRLASCLRPEDMLARLGGDEFAVLLELLPESETGKQIAQRILSVMQEPFVLAGHKFLITVSIGICQSSEDIADTDEYLRNADTAMYQAKREGKNRFVFFSPAMR